MRVYMFTMKYSFRFSHCVKKWSWLASRWCDNYCSWGEEWCSQGRAGILVYLHLSFPGGMHCSWRCVKLSTFLQGNNCSILKSTMVLFLMRTCNSHSVHTDVKACCVQLHLLPISVMVKKGKMYFICVCVCVCVCASASTCGCTLLEIIQSW